MSMTRNIIIGVGGLILFGIFSSFFTVNQTQQALVLQFGEPKRIIQDPGLAFKLPFIQDAIFYESRVLSLIPQDAEEVILADQKRIQIDAYARYRIEDPLLFFQTVRNELGARARLESIIDSSVRRVLGSETLASILTGERENINGSIRDEVNASVDSLGIEIIDVRLRRADYPESTSQNIFNRMKSEREREAKEFRATGDEEAQKIRADAEKTRTVIVLKRSVKLRKYAVRAIQTLFEFMRIALAKTRNSSHSIVRWKRIVNLLANPAHQWCSRLILVSSVTLRIKTEK